LIIVTGPARGRQARRGQSAGAWPGGRGGHPVQSDDVWKWFVRGRHRFLAPEWHSQNVAADGHSV